MKKSASLNQIKKTNSAKNLKPSKSAKDLKKLSEIDEKINKFKKSVTSATSSSSSSSSDYTGSKEVQDLVSRGYHILKDMNFIDEIKMGYHVRLKLKSTPTKKNDKLTKGGFLVKVVKEMIDGQLVFYIQLKAFGKIYRFNVNDIAYIFYKEVTPNAVKIDKLNKKLDDIEKQHKLDYLKLIKILKINNIKDKKVTFEKTNKTSNKNTNKK